MSEEVTSYRPYTSKSGLKQFKPSMELAASMIDNNEGFCLACGNIQDSVEPDARRYTCDCCEKPKVYGAEELVIRGLVY
jgi:hypothetical protein